MSAEPDRLVEAAIARLVGDDPLAAVLVGAAAAEHPNSFDAIAALAVVAPSPAAALGRARALARSRRQRQHLAVIEVWRAGDRDRGRLLAREHLAEFPGDLVISWLVGRA